MVQSSRLAVIPWHVVVRLRASLMGSLPTVGGVVSSRGYSGEGIGQDGVCQFVKRAGCGCLPLVHGQDGL